MSIQANDSAFPIPDTEPREWGLTKREYFAGLALQAILTGPCSRDGVPVREWFDAPAKAIEIADTLLLELAKT